jgi:tetratricopeptide (TPR) repeat protein
MLINKRILFLIVWLCLFALPAFAEKRVAVLPFEVLSEDSGMKQFGVGTMDTLTQALSNIPQFIMLDRGQLQAVMKENALQQSGFVDPGSSVKIGKLMGAEILVMGSIQTFKDKYRIVARFTDVQTGKILQSVQVIGTDIFDLQDKLAFEIINQQKVTVSINQRKRINNITKATGNVTAYDYYIKGRSAYLLYTEAGFSKAIELYDQALKLDDKYILALTAKAEAQVIKSVYYKLDRKFDVPLIKEAKLNIDKALEIDKNSPEAFRAIAYLYSINGYWKEAREMAQQAIELKPNDAESYYILWISTDKDKEPDPEDQLIIKSINLNPYIAQVRYMRGAIYSSHGKFANAILEFNKAIKLSPSLIQAYVDLAFAYKKSGKQKEAFSELMKALKINKDSEYLYSALIQYYSEPYNTVERIKYIKEALRVNPDNANNHGFLAYDYLITDKTDDAIAEYKRAIELDPELKYSYSNYYLTLGYIYENQNKMDEALNLYQQSLKVKPDDPESLANIAFAFYKQKKYDEAIKEAYKVLVIKADSYLAQDTIGRALIEQGKLVEAMEIFTKILKNNPNYASAYLNIGKIHQLQGNLTQAINSYKLSIKINPNYKKVYPEISKAYTTQGNNYYKANKLNEAIFSYKEAIKYMPDDSDTYNNLGTAYFNQEKIGEAVTEYKKAVFADPKNANAHDNLGIAYDKQGKRTEAVAEYKKACELGKQSTCDWLKEIGEK